MSLLQQKLFLDGQKFEVGDGLWPESVLEQNSEENNWTQEREVTVRWRKSHDELHDLYSSPNIIWVIISRRMRWS